MTTHNLLLGSLIAVLVACASAGACGGGNLAFSDTGGGPSGTTTGSTHASSSSGSSQAGTGGATTTTSTSTSTSAGTGGSAGCSSAADCSDGFSCTVDACNAGVCSHTVGPSTGPTACAAGSFCELGKGCVPGVVCATTAQCLTALGADACKANIACDPVTSICTYTQLDKDGDGHPPIVCGGDDCNDADPTIYPGAPEVCDGKDNNCNGLTDEGATCPGFETCTAGACSCPPANLCNGTCADLTTDPGHCGNCLVQCPSGAVCQNSTCTCAATATLCSGICIDTKTDPDNCNGCGHVCAAGYGCQNGACTCLGTACSGACVDTTSDPAHCGGCNIACQAGETCESSACVAAAACTHSECVVGGPLDPGCSTCAATVCQLFTTCCTTTWDTNCVFGTTLLCTGMTCP